MIKHIKELDLSGYGFYLNKVHIDVDTASNTNINLDFTMPFMNSEENTLENLERFLLDLKMLNRVKNNTSPAVQKHYEELLILLALSDEKSDK
jgi:hypothetical protein